MNEAVVYERRVVLRPKCLEDAADDYRWRTDEDLMALDATVTVKTPFQEYLRMYEQELQYPTPGVRRYGIDTVDYVHIGNCMCYDIDTVTGEGEIGILMGDRRYWGRGYGTEALAYLVEECFKIPPMRRFYLHTLEWNARARRAFAKGGFREVCAVWRNGKKFILMEITRREWEALRPEHLGLASGHQGPGV